MRTLIGLTVLMAAHSVWAGKITLQGISNLRHPVEFVSLRLDIRSRCASTASKASELTSLAKEQLKQVVQSHLAHLSGKSQILESGENTNLQDEYDRGQNTLLCAQAWTTKESLTIRTDQLKEVGALRVDLLETLTRLSQEHAEGLLLAMAQPQASLTPETVAVMETEGMKSALVDASLKLRAVQQVCEMSQVKISSIDQAASVVRDYNDGDLPAGDLNFDQQYVHQAWNVTWSFKDEAGICQ